MPRKINHREKVAGVDLISSQFGVADQSTLLSRIGKVAGISTDLKQVASHLMGDLQLMRDLLASTDAVVGGARLPLSKPDNWDTAFENGLPDLMVVISWVIEFNYSGFSKPSASPAPAPEGGPLPDPSK